MVILSTICVLCLCNKVRALAKPVYVPLDGDSSPRLSGAMLLLLVPILPGIALVGAGSFGIVGAAAFTVLPAILGIDLLLTSSKVPVATPSRYPSYLPCALAAQTRSNQCPLRAPVGD